MFQRITNRGFAGSLLAVVAMVFIMVIVGGLTRLTGSGLSMVDWKPLTGFIPPLTHADWMHEFQHYQQFPEYQKINIGMSLLEFKSIFWLEFIHRLLGRSIAFVLLIPTLITFLNPSFYNYRFNILLLWVLGAAQGLMGWYMVKSGLINDPMVSPYRLTAHLLLAFMILGYVLWLCARLLLPVEQGAEQSKRFQYLLSLSLVMIVLTVCYGGFTAGLHAGRIYNTFPMMGSYWIPPELFYLKPFWLNFFEEPVTVQFIHRCLAITTFVLILYIGYLGKNLSPCPDMRLKFLWLQLAITVQFLLGITTLVMNVPIFFAVIHQAWALIVFAIVLWLYLLTRRGLNINIERIIK